MKIFKEAKQLPKNAKVFIYGAGTAGKAFFFYLKKLRPDVKVKGFIDTYKKGRCCGYRVYKFDVFLKKIEKTHYDLILIASMYYEAIGKALSEKGIKKFALVKGKNPAYSVFVEERGVKTFLRNISNLIVKFLSLIFPKSEKRFIVVGEYGGNFVGNSKYFYLYLKNRSGLNPCWLTNKKEYYDYLRKQGINVIFYGKLKTFFLLLTSKYFIFDNRDWYKEYGLLNFLKTKKIQLWHGVGFKYIELSLLSKEFLDKLTEKEWKKLSKRYPQYDLLITTSEFYAEKVFAPAFNIPLEKIRPLGYPRNDALYREKKGEVINTDAEILKFSGNWKKKNGKISLFAPTFRDLSIKIDFRKIFEYDKFNEFLKANNILFIIKGHSLPGLKYLVENIDKYNNILIYESKKDVYPLLRITDLLITDYSSIYTDFLHTKRPVLFYPYDYEEYKELHRRLQFDYNKMTPGPKAKDFNELVFWIKHFLVEGKDGFESERERIFNLAFKYGDGKSSERVFREIVKT